MKFLRKNSFRISIFAFLFVWFTCGLAYWFLANSSNGDMFLFQEDVLLKSKIASFSNEADTNVDNGLIKPLFLNEDFYFLDIEVNEDINLSYKFDTKGVSSIGMDWMRFYSADWTQKGYNFFTVEKIDDTLKLINDELILYKLILCNIPSGSYDESTIVLPNTYKDKITEYKEYYVSFNGDFTKEYEVTSYYPIHENLLFLSNSHNYIDDTHKIIYDYEMNKEYSFSLMDFLYFSAVTISTLGYGDILPNSNIVRIIVMVETLLGLILIACVATTFYEKVQERHKRDKHRKTRN